MTEAWTGPEGRLTGTGMVADDLYLIAHHDRTGRPRLPPRAAGLALAGALLADLALAGQVAIAPAAVSVTPAAAALAAGGGPEGDPGWQAVRLIGRDPQSHPPDTWLEVLGRSAAAGIAARLAAAGYLDCQAGRLGRAPRWAPTDPDWAVMAIGRARRALDPDRPASPRDTTLTALAAAAGLGGLLAQYVPPGHLSPDTAALDLPPALRHLAGLVRGAVDSAVLTRRA